MRLGNLELKNTSQAPQRIAQILATCAVLTYPERLQIESGIQIWIPAVEGFSQSVSRQVEIAILLPNVASSEEIFPPIDSPKRPQEPVSDELPTEIFEPILQPPYPIEVVEAEATEMNARFESVLNDPERLALFESLRADPRFSPVVALLGVIESNLEPGAKSESGAIGPFQDMGGLQGAYGDLETVELLAANDLLPVIQNDEYNQILSHLNNGVRMDRGTLLTFLINQRNANSAFWQNFVTQQTSLLTTPETAAEIAYLYLSVLDAKVRDEFEIEDPLEAQNMAIMAYNSGFGNMRDLHRVMEASGETEFNTHSVLTFIERGRMQTPHEQAQEY